jgi:hypothetical protein
MWKVLLQGQLLSVGGGVLTHVGVFKVKTRMPTKQSIMATSWAPFYLPPSILKVDPLVLPHKSTLSSFLRYIIVTIQHSKGINKHKITIYIGLNQLKSW